MYVVALTYLFVDLFVLKGPLRQAMRRGNPQDPERIAAEKARGVVARVYYQPILLSQVDRRVEERLWKEGRLGAELGEEERKVLRIAALDELIDLHLLRLKVDFNARSHPVAEDEITAAVRRFASRFATPEEMREALRQQGWSERELRMRLAAKLQQEKYLEALIEVDVSEEEAREWYDGHKAELALPERVRARQIFVATLERDAGEARGILQEALGKLERKEAEFGALAADLSEDEGSKDRGGDLGWMQAGRLPGDFATPLFALPPGKPSLVRTKLGWHLVEVVERRPREERGFADARDEIVAALEALKRRNGWKLYREQLRKMEQAKVEIFYDVLQDG
ncbi:MAG: hypothetical protein HKN82_07155 [Akkermansiaceae bacterium]|nr:hypothetical protein [Akkermansiaceae bacterium]